MAVEKAEKQRFRKSHEAGSGAAHKATARLQKAQREKLQDKSKVGGPVIKAESALPDPVEVPKKEGWQLPAVGFGGLATGLQDAFTGIVDRVMGHRHDDDMARPTRSRPRFSVEKYWDADSTPPALAALSRAVGRIGGKTGARTPEIEAAIVMASLMHDVGYYYGGPEAQKGLTDKLFGDQIPAFVKRLNPSAAQAAKLTAMVDVEAVKFGGGGPLFDQSYSWSYGFEQPRRGYSQLADGEPQAIRRIAQETFKDVVGQISSGTFKMSGVLEGKLAKADPQYQKAIVAAVQKLAQSLQADFEKGNDASIPGFEPVK